MNASPPFGASPPKPALIEAHEARIAVDGVVAIDRLSLVTAGDRAVFAGDAGALFAALTGVPRSACGSARASADDDVEMPGEAYVIAGTLRLAGRSVGDAAHVSAMGAAVLDPPLPPQWTAEEYVAWGARLAGAKPRDARDLARASLARVGLGAAHRKKTTALALAERRALVLAQAASTSPDVIVAEAPLSGLDGPSSSFVLAAIGAVADGRRAVISVARLHAGTAEAAVARGASHLVVLSGSDVALEGPPADLFTGARVLALTVRSNAEPLRVELAARGIDLRGGPLRFSAALPMGATTSEIVAAAHRARASVVEMVPLLG